jgi:uncharacterized protein (TIGR02118 family)
MTVIKRVSLVNRKAGMPVEQFQHYWREVHAPLALAVPGLRCYVQSHTLLETYDAADPPAYDGIVETWWDSIEASEQARKTPQRALVDADQPNFIGASAGLITTEVAILDRSPSASERASMMKYIAVLHRRSDVSVEAFQTHWRDRHGPAFTSGNDAMLRYVQTHVLPETYGGADPPICDGVVGIWYDSLKAYRDRAALRLPSRDPLWKDYCANSERLCTQEIAFAVPM